MKKKLLAYLLSATMAVSAAAPCVTMTAAAAENTSEAVRTVQAAEDDSEEVVNGPEISEVTSGTDWSGKEYVYLPQLQQYSDDDNTKNYTKALVDYDAVKAGTAKVIINDTEMIAFDSEEHPELVYNTHWQKGLQLGTGAFKDGSNKIVIKAPGFNDKEIIVNRADGAYTFVSQKDLGNGGGNTDKPSEDKIKDPTENGEYTLTFKAYEQGKDTESMIGSAFDKKAKLVVKDGEIKISVLNTALKSFLLDFSIETDGTYPTSEARDYGKPDAKGEYSAKEYTMTIKNIDKTHEAAALVTAMDGQESDKGNYDKYTKADIKFTSLKKGWEGYQKDIDDAGSLTGAELTESVLAKQYDTDGDKKMSDEEMAAISGELDLSGCGLTDINILSKLSDKVTKLNISNNEISELPAGMLDNITNLEDFYAEDNLIEDLPAGFFKNNKSIKWITFYGNKLKSIEKDDFAGLSKMTILDLGVNYIEKIADDSFADLTNIDMIGLSENELTSLPNGLFKPMEKTMTYLGIDGNHMTRLPKTVSDAKALESFYAHENDLTSISDVDFSGMKNLKQANFMHNSITEIPSGTFVKNDALNSIDLYDNELKSLSTDVFSKNAKSNPMTKLDVRLNNMKVVDPAIRRLAQSFNKFYPQKSVLGLKVEKDGADGFKWSQQMDPMDLVFWFDETNSDKKVECTSADDYKTMLADNGWADKELSEVLDSKGYDWTVVTEVQKKNADGSFTTVSESEISDKADDKTGSYKASSGTFRVVKTVYSTLNSMTYLRYSAASDEVTAGAVKVAAPASVKAASAGYNKAKISWAKVKGASSYEVYKYDSKAKKYVKAGKATGTSLTVKGLTAGTKYSFKVRAYNKADKVYSGWSKTVSVKPVPAKTSVKAKNLKGKKAQVSWKKVDGASGYTVYRAAGKGSYKAVKTVKSGKIVKFTNKSLKKGATYKYKVKAYRTVKGRKIYGSSSSAASVKIKK